VPRAPPPPTTDHTPLGGGWSLKAPTTAMEAAPHAHQAVPERSACGPIGNQEAAHARAWTWATAFCVRPGPGPARGTKPEAGSPAAALPGGGRAGGSGVDNDGQCDGGGFELGTAAVVAEEAVAAEAEKQQGSARRYY
jgi:hypothetical protein